MVGAVVAVARGREVLLGARVGAAVGGALVAVATCGCDSVAVGTGGAIVGCCVIILNKAVIV